MTITHLVENSYNFTEQKFYHRTRESPHLIAYWAISRHTIHSYPLVKARFSQEITSFFMYFLFPLCAIYHAYITIRIIIGKHHILCSSLYWRNTLLNTLIYIVFCVKIFSPAPCSQQPSVFVLPSTTNTSTKHTPDTFITRAC